MISKKGMTDMKRSSADMKTQDSPGLGADYGYGTSITLDQAAMKKLGISTPPTVGDEYHVMAVANVHATSKTSITLQLTHMDLTHEDVAEEAGETPAQEKSEAAYTMPGMRAR
jgi:hypothetical protein